jgi:hypothetical protein
MNLRRIAGLAAGGGSRSIGSPEKDTTSTREA